MGTEAVGVVGVDGGKPLVADGETAKAVENRPGYDRQTR